MKGTCSCILNASTCPCLYTPTREMCTLVLTKPLLVVSQALQCKRHVAVDTVGAKSALICFGFWPRTSQTNYNIRLNIINLARGQAKLLREGLLVLFKVRPGGHFSLAGEVL